MENSTSENTNASNIEVVFEEVKPIETSRVRTGSFVESFKMYGVLVDVTLSDGPNGFSASRQEWFPKSLCKMETIEHNKSFPHYYLTAPHWLLDMKKVKYEK